jgi:hypothetical protein
MENTNTNTFVLGLIEQAVQHITLRVIESMGAAIVTKVEETLDANENLSVLGSTIIALRADVDALNQKLDTVVLTHGDIIRTLDRHDKAIALIAESKPDLNSESLKKLIQTYVTDYLDDNRTLSRMDEAIDNLSTRVDDLEAEDGSGFSRKLTDHIENVVQDKLDSSEFVAKDGLQSAVADAIQNGSFDITFNR